MRMKCWLGLRIGLFFALCLGLAFAAVSQPILHGLARNGGEGGGVIFSFEAGSNRISSEFTWQNFGSNPAGNNNVILASDGFLYGMTANGGKFGLGVIFSFNPVNNTFRKLFDFSRTSGFSPNGKFVQVSNGKLYGITSAGGDANGGTIFSFNPVTERYEKILSLSFRTGTNSSGSLTLSANGKLFGLTRQGGSNNSGTIFSFDPNNNSFRKLADLTGFQTGSLIEAN